TPRFIPSDSSTPPTPPHTPPRTARLIPSDSSTPSFTSDIAVIVEDDSTVQEYSIADEVLPTYHAWEDIPPIYATLRIPPEFAGMARTEAPRPSYTFSSIRHDSGIGRPPTPPLPTPTGTLKRKQLRRRFDLTPEQMDAIALAGARKQVQDELVRAGLGWAGPLARRIPPRAA
ncbi:hypothetical protein CALCODRAFT_485113, partial [Calocera cornea HHB12733]